MNIWFKDYRLIDTDWMCKNNMVEHIGIKLIEIGSDYLEGTMPVDHRTVQPMAILHGGASVVLAESLGSIASNLVVDYSKFYCVGMEVNANHLRPAKSGFVTGRAKSIHIGKKTHVWSIEIKNEQGQMICISRLTMAVVERTN